jgi:multidrug resistance efflux pump
MTRTPQKSPPTLDLTAPLRAGFLVAGLSLLVLGACWFIEIAQGPLTSATGITRTEPVVVRHADGGLVARVHAAVGTEVQAGQLLISLDTRSIDSQLAGLKTQADANKMRRLGLQQEADALAAMDRLNAQRGRLAGLQAQMADIEQEGLGLQVRIAMAEQERKRTEVRAPVSGQIVSFAFTGENAVLAARAPIVTVRPSLDLMVLETVWPAGAVLGAHPGQAARVWLAGAPPWQASLPGVVEANPADEVDGVRSSGHVLKLRIAVDLAETVLRQTASQVSTQRFDIQLVTRKVTLIEHIFAPFGVTPTVAAIHP